MKRVVSCRVDCQSLDEALKIASYVLVTKGLDICIENEINIKGNISYLVSWKEPARRLFESVSLETLFGVEE